MPDELKMTIDERRKVLGIMQPEYRGANRKRRSELLDQAKQLTGLHRKSLIRLLNGDLKRKPRRRQRGSSYGPEVDDALRVISESVDHSCAQRLVGNLSCLHEWFPPQRPTQCNLELGAIGARVAGRMEVKGKVDFPYDTAHHSYF